MDCNYYVGAALVHVQRTRIHATCALRTSQNFADKTFADGSAKLRNCEKRNNSFLPRKCSAIRYMRKNPGDPVFI